MNPTHLRSISDFLAENGVTVNFAINQDMTDSQLRRLITIIDEVDADNFLKEDLENYVLEEIDIRPSRRKEIRARNVKNMTDVRRVIDRGEHAKELPIYPNLARYMTEFVGMKKVKGDKKVDAADAKKIKIKENKTKKTLAK